MVERAGATGHVVRRVVWKRGDAGEAAALVQREWLVTNGLGGYASASLPGVCTRRYHGLLIAAHPAPLGRLLMLNHLDESVEFEDRRVVHLGGEERANGSLELHALDTLAEFRLEDGLPVWRYEAGSAVIEKRVMMPHLQNTVHIRYRLLAGDQMIRLRLRPSLHFRPHDARVDQLLAKPYTVIAMGERFEVRGSNEYPPLRLLARGERTSFILDGGRSRMIFYRVEHSRGYDASGVLWSPGYLRAELKPGTEAALSASTDPWDMFVALEPEQAYQMEAERRRRLLATAVPETRTGFGEELVLAADQFVVVPVSRMADTAEFVALGDEARSVIAGYHWFTDWGRDTMIGLEGLTLSTGRIAEAGRILRTFSRYVRYGLIPNMFPEREQEGRYNTADASLWYFHAIHRYVGITQDRDTLRMLLPVLMEIIHHHAQGTRFGIGMDPRDGLIRQGQQGYALTWMDAKVGDWVVTPRRGKPVEINALWYNALRLMERWMREEHGEAAAKLYGDLAGQAKESFNGRYWYEEGGYLYDIVDGEGGDDRALRPNQLFSFTLEYPVLDPRRWHPVFETVRTRLMTPFGLRTLASDHPEYQAKYYGDLRARDAAYHQGTVWAWLTGAFIDAWLRVHPNDREGARRYVEGMESHLSDACIGQISEIFDAERPYTPRGCVAQAWSVAEVLRCLVRTAREAAPPE